MKDQKPDAHLNLDASTTPDAGASLSTNAGAVLPSNGGTDLPPDAEATLTPPTCPRAGDLVSYLYEEATPQEARSFTEHLSACAACRDELKAFGGVRASVGAWRAEALGVAASVGMDGAHASPPTRVSTPRVRERSALAALREFFALSPRWLQAASVAAALLLCALAALTLARAEVRWDAQGLAVRTLPDERIAEKRTDAPVVGVAADSRAELNALAAERDRFKSELEALRAQQQGDAATLNASATQNGAAGGPRRGAASQIEVGLKDVARRRRAPRSGSARAGELARNRGLDEREEDNLPRLSDLLREVK
jgi:hypothetical protein